MNDKTPIAVLTYRIEQIEKRLNDLELRFLSSSQKAMNEIWLLKESKANKPSVKIDITKENKRAIKNGRRTSQVCRERWDKWNQQLKSGMSIAQIAAEWGCSRKAIYYAIKRKFNSDCNKKEVIIVD